MGRPRKSKGETLYPPLGMRCDRAASYLDMSEANFLRLVASGDLPPGIRIKGITLWDRHELEASFENWKSNNRDRKRNTFNDAIGIDDG